MDHFLCLLLMISTASLSCGHQTELVRSYSLSKANWNIDNQMAHAHKANISWMTYGANSQHSGFVDYDYPYNFTINNTFYYVGFKIDINESWYTTSVAAHNGILYYIQYTNPKYDHDYSIQSQNLNTTAYFNAYSIETKQFIYQLEIKTPLFNVFYSSGPSIANNTQYVVFLAGGNRTPRTPSISKIIDHTSNQNSCIGLFIVDINAKQIIPPQSACVN